ncbi:MAG: ROK family protein [Bacteroidota bacterium]
MKEYVIGFDLGGTRLKSGAVSRTGEVGAAGIQPSGYHMVPATLIKTYVEEVERISEENGKGPQAVGLAFSGAVDPRKGVVYLPGKVKGLEGYPIVEELEQRLGVPVIADNDGRISIYAEAAFGQAQDCKWAVTITLGTGVGSGVMLDGKILRDPHLQFGTQMGHIVQQAGGRLCITNARGTAEMFCSATALAMNVRDGLARGIESVLSDAYFTDPRTVDFKAIIVAVEQGDRLCTDELNVWTEQLGWLLVSTIHVYAPEKIILSGGASNAARHFLEPLKQHVNSHIFRYPTDEPVPIVISKLQDHAGVLGTGALAWEYLASLD